MEAAREPPEAEVVDAAGEDRQGVGSLPRVASEPLCLDSLSTRKPVAGNGPVVHVLCVEDDVVQQSILMQLFQVANERNHGAIRYDVTIASSSEQALDAIVSQGLAPDLVLIDVVMDGLSGDELLIELRRILPYTVAIVMASAVAQVELVKKCVDNGADGYLVKPLHISTVQLAWQYCYRKRSWLTREVDDLTSSSSEPTQPVLTSGAAYAPEGQAPEHAGSSDVADAHILFGLQPIRFREGLDSDEDNVGACRQQ